MQLRVAPTGDGDAQELSALQAVRLGISTQEGPMMRPLNELSLFSGYGGFSAGLRLAGLEVRTIGYVEIDPYCQQLLRARIRDGFLDWAPIITDIRAADFRPMAGLVDIITAGFPCQPHSTSRTTATPGASDKRNLWPSTLRTVSQVAPRVLLLENVAGILFNGYAGTVVGQLSELGYDCRWGVVSAAAVGAPHLRRRWWCLAHSTGSRWTGRVELGETTWSEYQAMGRDEQPFSYGGNWSMACPIHDRPRWWEVEPALGRVADGPTNRVGQLRALGNGVIPAVVAEFLRRVR
jgi:DNA (cytosine-5)-methyltransferase 1